MIGALKEIQFRLATHQVKVVRWLTNKAFVVRMDRNNMEFEPGQYLRIQLKDGGVKRYYSIYSSVADPYIEILVVEVENGKLTQDLKKVEQGSELEVIGPRGHFKLEQDEMTTKKYLWVATGTGIAPYRSFIRSYPNINYKLIHGVRYGFEAYDKIEYDPERFVLCTSRDTSGDFNGRVTDFLKEYEIDEDEIVYLCGNSQMINDAIKLLLLKGLHRDNIRTEIYF